MATSRFSALCFGCSILLLMGACEESAEIWGAAGEAGAAESQEEKEMVLAEKHFNQTAFLPDQNQNDPLAWLFGGIEEVESCLCRDSGNIGALHDVLEKLRNSRLPSVEKKFGWVPSCDAGEPCAVRKGARIGKLCNCPRGTSCNLYILKCL